MAVKVYSIKCDLECPWLLPDDDSFWKDRLSRFACTPLEEEWSKRRFYISNPLEAKDMNFMRLKSNGCFVFGEAVYNSHLGDLMCQWGESLEIEIEDLNGEAYIYNILNCYNCLDKEKTVFRRAPRSDVNLGILTYAFKANRIGESLFKIPEFPSGRMYAITGRGDDEEDFYLQYHKHGFTGLKFEQVWSDSDD